MAQPLRAAIIAGGKGTRIRSISGGLIPKSLVPVAGSPIVFRQLELLARYGFTEVAIIAGHLAEQLQSAIPPEAARLGLRVEFFVESSPLGTAGGLLAARRFFGDADFVTMYGDMAVEMDLARLVAFHRAKGGVASLVVHPNDHPHESDLVVAGSGGRVSAILPRKGRPAGWYRNLVPAGVYCLSAGILDCIAPGGPQDFIADVFPRALAAELSLFACNTPEYIRDMGTADRYAMAERDILSGQFARMNFARKRPAVFLARDGVLIEEVDPLGLADIDKLALTPRAGQAVRAINEAGLLAIVVTNQPVVAKGRLSVAQLEMMHAKLETLLGRQGAKLDGIYACPHHPERGFAGEVAELKIDCDCRKPRPGLLRAAANDLPVLMERSCLIGDSARDVGAARAAGIACYGVRTGFGCRDCPADQQPDKLFDDVLDAVRHAVGRIMSNDE